MMSDVEEIHLCLASHAGVFRELVFLMGKDEIRRSSSKNASVVGYLTDLSDNEIEIEKE